jgi:hypothetical protein
MRQVLAEEAVKKQEDFRTQRHFSPWLIRYALSAGGIVLGLINLFRIYWAVLSPVACK